MNAIVRKDFLVLRREALLSVLLAVTVVLVLISLLAGLQRERVFAKEKAAAEQTDRAVWMNQGDRNPHSAAHFSRYAFRPASPLALLDPGTSDFAGLAVWMEAHYQDPAVFRRAEDGGELSRYALLSPAFLLLTAAPLLIFLMLHASIAGEREDGTLRQLLATGVGARRFFGGKLGAGWGIAMLVYTVVFLLIAGFSALTTPATLGGDAVLRLAILYLVYAAYLSICVAVALAVSALFRTRQAAFIALAGVWILMVVLAPRLGADAGVAASPQPDPRTVAQELRAASDIWFADKERQQQIQDELLEQYEVTNVEDLPINYGAYTLQVSEDLSVPEFERVYDGLDSRYRAQETVMRGFSLLSPAIAASSLSRGAAGTDRAHQKAFTVAAELHRRDMVRLLNEDYMYNAGDAGRSYTADAALWAQFEDLDHELPAFAVIGGRYAADAALLLLWLGAALLAAHLSVQRAIRHEVPTA